MGKDTGRMILDLCRFIWLQLLGISILLNINFSVILKSKEKNITILSFPVAVYVSSVPLLASKTIMN